MPPHPLTAHIVGSGVPPRRLSSGSYAREGIRGEFSFGEQILDIADNTADDWCYNPKSGKLSVNKEAILRSKLRIEARQFHMSRLHPQQ
jgi:hypothetical protein